MEEVALGPRLLSDVGEFARMKEVPSKSKSMNEGKKTRKFRVGLLWFGGST